MALLCHYNSTIIDNDNNSTNIEGSNVISNVELDISQPELKEVMYGRIEWNYNEINITWRTQTREHLIFYITMPISCNINLKSMIGLATKYGLRYVELYLNSIPK